jgi:AraC family transcriptional regulator, transcriptional activator FtrA
MNLRNVAVVVFDPVPVFELGVACEVFGLDRGREGLPTYDFAVCAVQRRSIPTTSGFSITPTHGIDRMAEADLLVVAATPPSTRPIPAALLEQIRAGVSRGAVVAGVCTGAFVLAEAGVLDGRRATTHWQHAAQLSASYPRVRVDPQRLYVQDGPVYTSAGSAAAIDLLLHLVREAHGAEIANRVARRIVVPPHRDGGQAQYIETSTTPARSAEGDIAQLLDWALEHLDQDLSVDHLAAQALMSPRTFARRFQEATGTTPRAWLNQQRLVEAQRLLEASTDTVEQIALDSGFGSADTLRRHFIRVRGVNPEQYRRTFQIGAADSPHPPT